MTNKNNRDSKRDASRVERVARGAGTAEIVERHGNASAEFIKDYRGKDNLTGQTFARSHAKVSGYRLDPANPESSRRQQAGFSAEIAKTSKENSRNIIDRRNVKLARTDDIPGYGGNHPVGDHIELRSGRPDPATLSQMKFVDNPQKLLDRIACGRDGGKTDLSRYLGANALDVPSEQVDPCRSYCAERASELRQQAKALRQRGQNELAEQKAQQARNFDKLRSKIRDSGMTRDEALAWRINPLTETGKEMLGIGHEAGVHGARIGLAVGLVFATVTTAQRWMAGELSNEEAAQYLATGGAFGAVGGYVTAATGTMLQASLRQSENVATRALSMTTAPALAIGVCKSLGSALYRFGRGDIEAAELQREATDVISGTAMSTMASSVATTAAASVTAGTSAGIGAGAAVAALGPVIAPMVAGTVGYLVACRLLQGYRDACKAAEVSRQRLEKTRQACELLSAIADARRAELQYLFETRLAEFAEARSELRGALNQLDTGIAAGEFAAAIDSFANSLGRTLDFPNLSAFDKFMADEDAYLRL